MSVINKYLAGLPELQRAELQRIRAIVLKNIPDATEAISYGMPAFKYKNKYLVGYCAFKNHLSIFPGAHPIEVLGTELSAYKTAKGTVQFTLEKPLPEALIMKIVTIRRDDIDDNAEAKKQH